jgi:hypothetical protein
MKIKAKNKRKQLNIRGMAIVVTFAIALGTGAYLGDYYQADEQAMSIVRQNAVANQKNGMICFESESFVCMFICRPTLRCLT